ncbi:MAG: CpaD family pilus assembly protein [Beijerinckiaceae bacterium]
MRIKSKLSQPASLSRGLTLALLAGLLPLMAACGKVDRLSTVSSTVPFDYQKRHPIQIKSDIYSIKVYPANGGLTRPDRARIADLAQRYRENGRGSVVVEFPQESAGDRGVLQAIRTTLAANGARGRLHVTSYRPADEEIAPPVRVSIKVLQASVATRCGEWPDDMASASSLNGWNNKPYWNLGCSYQNMLAQQTADPRDLAGPRGETPPDVVMRTRAISNVRKGTDPSTKWQVKNTTINNAGGN